MWDRDYVKDMMIWRIGVFQIQSSCQWMSILSLRGLSDHTCTDTILGYTPERCELEKTASITCVCKLE